MKIAYITGDIAPNGNFSLFHDLLGNYPCPNPNWRHRLYLVAPTWDRGLVKHLKDRYIDVRACFEEFQDSTDAYWEKIRQDTEDCDVIISGNITNLDEILPDSIEIPIVSLSLAEKGYRSPTGGYGSFYKERFHKTAVSRTAVNAFPEHVRKHVTPIKSGVDPSRVSPKVTREQLREAWFPENNSVKLMLFIGAHQDSKKLSKVVESLNYLPANWYLILLSPPGNFNIPDNLKERVKVCNPTFFVGDIYQACDCFVLPTEHEGLSMSLLEAWYLGIPVVTTQHNTIRELQIDHPDVNFGEIVPIECTPQMIAEAASKAKKSDSAQDCVYKNYMASNMVQRWQKYLQQITGKE